MPNLIPTSLSLWAGIYNVIFAFRAGAAVIIMDRFDAQAFAGFVERFQLRSTVLPPAAMTMLADDESITSLAPLKYVRSITAPLSPLQARRFRDRFGVFVLNGWGQTEIGGEIVGWSAQDAKEFGDTHLGAVGRAHENVQLRISEDLGEILVRTPMIEERVATGDDMDGRLVDGWFHTGDLGRVDDEGFLWIEGRVSDMINRGGLKVFPEEVAEVIRLSPDVAECAVAGIPDDRLGEVPWAFVVPRDGASVDADALEALCREHLAPYKVPARFEALDALPRNEVGKVLLRELVARGRERPDPCQNPRHDPTQRPVPEVRRCEVRPRLLPRQARPARGHRRGASSAWRSTRASTVRTRRRCTSSSRRPTPSVRPWVPRAPVRSWPTSPTTPTSSPSSRPARSSRADAQRSFGLTRSQYHAPPKPQVKSTSITVGRLSRPIAVKRASSCCAASTSAPTHSSIPVTPTMAMRTNSSGGTGGA